MNNAENNEGFIIDKDWCTPTVINQYPIPPLVFIIECPIYWTLARATCKKHAKHLAASIILGQPFNRKYGE